MKISTVSAKGDGRNPLQERDHKRYKAKLNRIQLFLDDNPEFAEVYERAQKKNDKGFSLIDRSTVLSQLVHVLGKFYNLTPLQQLRFTDEVKLMEDYPEDSD